MLDLLFNIIIVLIVYQCFERGGFKSAVLVKLIYQGVLLWFEGTFTEFLGLGAVTMLIYIAVLLIANIILTAIEQWAYDRTNHFLTYFILATIAEYVFSLLISAVIITFIII